MALTFLPLEPNNYGGKRYAAVIGAWPNQRRFLIERWEREWSVEASYHEPGKGWLVSSMRRERTLAKAKAECEELANPTPPDRNSSAYTDA